MAKGQRTKKNQKTKNHPVHNLAILLFNVLRENKTFVCLNVQFIIGFKPKKTHVIEINLRIMQKR